MHPLWRALRHPVDPEDPDCVDPELIAALREPVIRFGQAWYRLELIGQEHLPEGKALIVGNHNSGASFLEAIAAGAMILRDERHPLAGLAHDAVIDAPIVGRLLSRIGAVRAGHDSAARAFAAGRKVVVFPGGNREAFRRYADRHRVLFEGRTGFVRLALRHQVDIVPWAFSGHRTLIVLRDGQRVAKALRADRWLRSDTWPLYLGLPWGVAFGPLPHLPLPTKVRSALLAPVRTSAYGPEAEHDEAVVRAVYGEVVARLQGAIEALRR